MFTAPWLGSVFFLDRTPTKKTSTMKSRDNSPSGGGLNEWKKNSANIAENKSHLVRMPVQQMKKKKQTAESQNER